MLTKVYKIGLFRDRWQLKFKCSSSFAYDMKSQRVENSTVRFVKRTKGPREKLLRRMRPSESIMKVQVRERERERREERRDNR